VTYLGPDTPLDALDSAAESLAPALLVVTSVDTVRVERVIDELSDLARRYRLALGGTGADEDTASEIGATFLGGDPVAAADAVTALQPSAAGA
jgi:methanogenic corrinoid protein MtbC1